MDTRDVICLMGRRTALRYGLAGVVAAALAACSRNGDSTSIKFQTLDAFLQGAWAFEAETGDRAKITVQPGGNWVVTGGEEDNPWSEQGTWSLAAGNLSMAIKRQEPYIVHDLPKEAEKALAGSYTISGGLTDGQDKGYRKMQVSYSKNKVVLTFPDYVEAGRTRVVTCTKIPEAP
ncbi:hypothetical protein [Streptomyces sp. NPDC096033]|uniref:hypothetical protein n=1 Tax=Streptomyces sp. NPDC096033 TaxID=3366071 RepID=UPI0038072FE0